MTYARCTCPIIFLIDACIAGGQRADNPVAGAKRTDNAGAGGNVHLAQCKCPHAGTAPQRNSEPHGTYVQFGNRGDQLIATYHGDHAYSFDVTASEQPPIAAFRLPPQDETRCRAIGSGFNWQSPCDEPVGTRCNVLKAT